MKSVIFGALTAFAQGAMPEVSTLSIDALIGQMSQVTITVLGEIVNGTFTLNDTKLDEAFTKYQIGSVLNSPFSAVYAETNATAVSGEQWQAIVKKIQDAALAKGSKVPMLYGLDSIHGANYIQNSTLFPQPINGASSFNRVLVERQGYVTAKDTRTVGIPWLFAPILGIAIQPQWPRVYETLGEDPFLVSQMGAAMVKGIQGFPANISSLDRGAACMKHFFGYSDPRYGHDRSPAWIPERYLRMHFMPPFQAAINAGVATAMESYGDINGIPLVSSKLYLDTILRKQMNFTGMLVTDWAEIRNLHEWHHVASSLEEATRLALQASDSLDMSMVATDYSFPDTLKALVTAGKITRGRLEAAVTRILKLKQDLGLFDDPYGFSNVSRIGSPEDIASSRELAQESMILLKNNGNLLPLNPNATLKILVTGPTANSLRRMNSGWTIHWQGAEDFEFWRGSSILKGLQDFAATTNNITVIYEPGCDIIGQCDPAQLNASVEAAKTADIVLVCVGEDSYCEKPGDIDDLSISAGQQQLVTSLANVGKPVVMLLLEGRPRILHGIADLVNATVLGWLPGPEGGAAFADLLFGKLSFSAKLPMTYPRDSNAILAPYWHAYSVDTNNPQWPFGHGLSYTTFSYSEFTVTPATLTTLDEETTVSVRVTNTGNMSAKEIVLLYVSDLYRIIAPEVGMLKGFEKIELDVNESTVVTFKLTAREHMWFTTVEGPERAWEDGAFVVQVGGGPLNSARNLKSPLLLSTGAWPANPISYPSCPAPPDPQPACSDDKGVVESGGVLFLYLLLAALAGSALMFAGMYLRHGRTLCSKPADRYEDIET